MRAADILPISPRLIAIKTGPVLQQLGEEISLKALRSVGMNAIQNRWLQDVNSCVDLVTGHLILGRLLQETNDPAIGDAGAQSAIAGQGARLRVRPVHARAKSGEEKI